jgi:hypothetical protein
MTYSTLRPLLWRVTESCRDEKNPCGNQARHHQSQKMTPCAGHPALGWQNGSQQCPHHGKPPVQSRIPATIFNSPHPLRNTRAPCPKPPFATARGWGRCCSRKSCCLPRAPTRFCTQVAARGGSPEGAWYMGSKTHDGMPLGDGVDPWAACAVLALTLGVDGWMVDHLPWSQEQATHQSLSLIPIAVA